MVAHAESFEREEPEELAKGDVAAEEAIADGAESEIENENHRRQKRENRKKRLVAWGTSVAVHALALLILFTIIFHEPGSDEAPIPVRAHQVDQPPEEQPERELEEVESEIMDPTDMVTEDPSPVEIEVDVEVATVADAEVISEAAVAPTRSAIGGGATGAGMMGGGAGFNLGTGSGGGSKSFMGVTTKGPVGRLLFIIDMSKSLKEDQVALIKDNLMSSLEDLGRQDSFNVIFFSGPSWLVDTDPNSQELKGKWKKGGSAHDFTPLQGLPEVKWLPARLAEVDRFRYYLKDLKTSFGTDWRHPFRMAYETYPQPETIIFLTDGKVDNAEETLELVKANRRIPVHTVAFGLKDKDGVEALDKMARITRGSHVSYTHEEIDEMYKELTGKEPVPKNNADIVASVPEPVPDFD